MNNMKFNFSSETTKEIVQSQAIEIVQLRKEVERLTQENRKLFLNAVRH